MPARLLTVVLGALLAVSLPASAHHAFGAEFDADRPILLKGKIVKVEWVNPHTWLHLTVDDGKGGKVEWAAEGRAPGVLLRAGWTRSSLKAGETVTVDMSPAKNGTLTAIIARVTKADGTILSNNPAPQ